jgi:hypothetical protein
MPITEQFLPVERVAGGYGTMIEMLRRLIALAVGIALVAPAGAQVFRPRGSTSAKTDAKKPAPSTTPKDDSDASAKRAPAKKAVRAAPVKKAPAKTKAPAKADPDFVEITDDDDD